jgi:hypothetical protein
MKLKNQKVLMILVLSRLVMKVGNAAEEYCKWY